MEAGAEAEWWPASPAAELLHDRRAVIPVIGAGLSAAAGMPSSAELAARLASWLPDDVVGGDLFAVADAAFHANAEHRHAIQRDVAAAIADAPIRLTEAHRALVMVRSRVLVTFNYDEVLEEAAKQARIPFESCTYRETEQLVEHLRERERRRLLIYHAHGSVVDPTSIVIDDAGYRDLSNDRAVSRAFEYLADLNTLCFLGTRLDEPYLQATLLRLPSPHPRHVLIGDDATVDEVARPSRRGALLPWRYGIVTCSVGESWSALPGFCRRLAGRGPSRRIDVPSAAPVSAAFVDPVIVRAATPGTELQALAMLAFPSDEVLAQSDVVRAWRALVVAPAGSGKSTVLRHIAAHQPETECPVVVELRRLRHLRGSPGALLEHWVRHGEGVGRTEVDLDARLYLLLDGLDEIDASRQAEAAETIVALAEAFPQHRLLVTSRRVRAIEALLRAGFADFELRTSRVTAERFLWARGTTAERLRQRLPHVHHLGPLAANPLVLDTLIDLAERVPDELPPFRRLLRMLDAVVERLCAREARRIAYTAGELRRAVSALAATLQLFDLRAVAVASLSQLAEPLLDDAGTSRRLLHDAALRLLASAEDDGLFEFLSPTLAAFMAADHVLRLDPDATRALRAVAPVVEHEVRQESPRDGRLIVAQVTRAGVRSDLAALASILAARSDAWADALWATDPQLVASVASPGCVRPSARARARELWRAIEARGGASEWLPGGDWLPEPELSLGALLREQPFPRLERELVATALSDRETAGAAVVAAAASGRLAPRTLTRIVNRTPPHGAPAVLRAVRIAQRGDLVGPILKRQLAAAAPFAPVALDEVSRMVADHGAAGAVLEALAGADPAHASKPFWDLVGVVRIAGRPDDVVRLWILLLNRHSRAFKRYVADNWMVLWHLLERVDPRLNEGQTIMLGEAGYDALGDFLASLKRPARRSRLTLDKAVTRAEGFVGEQREIEASEMPEPPRHPELLPRRKLRWIVERIAVSLAPSETDYASFVPGSGRMQAEIEAARAARGKDPVVLINELLAAGDSVMDRLGAVLARGERLDAWSRRRLGVRIEEVVPALAPGSASEHRVALLEECGAMLDLAPTEEEWLALAVDGFDRGYLALHPPPLPRLRELLRDGDAAVVAGVLAAAPVGWRMPLLDDAIAGLEAAAAGHDAVLKTASLIAEAPGRAEGIARLREAFPQFADDLAGWSAATGDRDALAAALDWFLRAARAGDEDRVFGVAVGWFEQALERLPSATLDPVSVIAALPEATLAFGGGVATDIVGESIGALAIANAPLDTAVVLALLCAEHEAAGLPKAYATVRDAAVDGAHRAAGARAAAAALGTTTDAVRGCRNIAHVEVGSRSSIILPV